MYILQIIGAFKKCLLCKNFVYCSNIFTFYKGVEFTQKFSNPFIFATQCRRSLIVQTINSVRSNIKSLHYQVYKKRIRQ